jgi:hypothetical protein
VGTREHAKLDERLWDEDELQKRVRFQHTLAAMMKGGLGTLGKPQDPFVDPQSQNYVHSNTGMDVNLPLSLSNAQWGFPGALWRIVVQQIGCRSRCETTAVFY